MSFYLTTLLIFLHEHEKHKTNVKFRLCFLETLRNIKERTQGLLNPFIL